MAVARQLDVDEAGIFVVGNHLQDRGEIQISIAEHEVLVFAVADVFDVDVADQPGKLAIHLPERHALRAERMADIQCEAEARAGDVFLQDLEFRHVIDEHAGLGFEGELDAATFGVFGELEAAGHEPIPRLMLRYVRLGRTGPEANAFGLQFVRDVDGAPQKFQPDLPAFDADQCRVMFALWIEQVSRAGFDHDAELEFFEKLPEFEEPGGLGRERVAVVRVQRERDAPVARLGDDVERFLQGVVGEAVGVVAESQIHRANADSINSGSLLDWREEMNSLLLITVLAIAGSPSGTDPSLFRNTEAVRQRDPARAVLFQGRGIEFVKTGNCEAAVEQFRRASAYDPLNVNPLVNMAFCLDKLGRYEQAIEELQRADIIDPNNATVHLNLGNSQINLKRFSEAVESLERAIRLDASNQLARVNLAAALTNLGRNQEASDELARAAAINPNNPHVYMNWAIVLSSLGKVEQAVEKYERVIALDPTNLSAYYNAAALLEKLGRIEAAVEKIEAALKIEPENQLLQEILAKLREASHKRS